MEKINPLVSIGIPAYNHERYVQDCIRSIMDQDYENIELIVIDDGSTDDTWNKIMEMRPLCEKRFKRFVAQRQENQGAAETGRRLKAQANGILFGVIASDDQYLPGAISALVKPLMEDEGIGLVVGVNEIMDSEGRTCYWDGERNIVYYEKSAVYRTFNEFIEHYSHIDFYSDQFGSYQELIKVNHVPNGSLQRLSIYTTVLPKADGPLLEDWWFHLQFSKVAKYKAIPQHTFRYRWHATNTIKNKAYIARTVEVTRICERDLLVSMTDQKWRDLARPWINVVRVKWKFWKFFIWTVDTVDEHIVRIGHFRLPLTVLRKRLMTHV